MPAPLSRTKRVLFSLVVLCLLLGLLEIAARIGLARYRGFDGKHLYQYAFDPYRNIHPTPDFVDTRGIRHNAVGFRRSSEVPVEKPAGTYRIFLMGASTAYGLGGLFPHIQRDFEVLKNEETIDHYLEGILGDSVRGLRVEVINAAVTSTWTHHHLIYLNQRILRYDPDMILFLDGFNDFFKYDRGHDQFASYSYGLPSRVIMGDPTFFALAYGNAWWLFRKSAAAHVASRTASALANAARWERGAPVDVDSALARLQRIFPQNALKMHERIGLITRAESVRTVFMMQPLLILERERRGMPPVERKLFEYNVSAWPEGYEAFSRRAVPFLRDEERRMAERVGATFLDLTQPFDGVEGQVYTDYAHLTPLGNRRLAERIATEILPMIRADAAGPRR